MGSKLTVKTTLDTSKGWCLCCSLQQTYEMKRQEFLAELQRREEEMKQTFVQRVKEKEAELKEAEKEVRNKACFLCPPHFSSGIG